MRIGIDLDDVVWEHFGPVLDHINEKKGTDFKFEELKTFKIWESFNISKADAFDSVKSFHDSGKMDQVSLIEDSREVINDLEKNNELFFITSRSLEFKEQTLSLLKKNGFNLPVIFSRHLNEEDGKTKFEICIDKNIDYMIEDSANNATECAEGGIKVILFDKPWNQGTEHKNIIRIKSWMEIRSILK